MARRVWRHQRCRKTDGQRFFFPFHWRGWGNLPSNQTTYAVIYVVGPAGNCRWYMLMYRNVCAPFLLWLHVKFNKVLVVLFHCGVGPTGWSILGDVHDTITGSGLGLHRLGLEEISGDQCLLSLGNAVLETGVAQICQKWFSVTVADCDSMMPRLAGAQMKYFGASLFNTTKKKKKSQQNYKTPQHKY